MQKLTLIMALSGVLAACGSDTTSVSAPADFDAQIELANQQIEEAGLMERVGVLASDEFEGRAPSTAGGRKTVEYLEQEFAKAGLKPAFENEDGASYRQAVELIEQTVVNDPQIRISHANGESEVVSYGDHSIAFTKRVAESSELVDSQMVFVGYGVVAPEYGWNDYEGIDMTGKTAVILVNDPGYRAADSELFKGNTMTYYGRWTYKYEEAARQGAAGAIVIHETGAAGYPWEVVGVGWSGPQYMLYTEDGNADESAVAAWISTEAAENLMAKNGLDYAELVEQAGKAEFKPVVLDSTISTSLELENKRSVSYNVAGKIDGSKRPDEAFIFTAHWDHMGVKPDVDGDDKIYNGAQDNATGTAGLIEMAEAFMAMPSAPERSVVFLAVTAEESGLLGSAQYAENPVFPMSMTVAGINTDSMPTWGETNDVVVVGYGNSEMDTHLAEVASKQGRVLVQEPTPEKGFFYRSDHFNLAKKGVPMLYAKAGTDVRGKPVGYGKQESERYIAERYHKPGDEIHAEWDSSGIIQDLKMNFMVGVKLANSDVWPKWSEGNEFKAIREASQASQ